MSTETHKTPFETFLHQHDAEAWAKIVSDLLPAIHEVDRTATEIWFHFFPLELLRALEQADDLDKLAHELELQGNYFLKNQIDTSHTFLYGHRFWPEVKRAVGELAATTDASSASLPLVGRIREVAARVAAERKVEESLVVGIAAVALMTLQQTGFDAFRAAPGAVALDDGDARRSPARILQERARDDSQGLLGFLRTNDKVWTVVWDEHRGDRRFKMINQQEIASAAATDKRDWSAVDPRCTIGEGPIPVQCRSASCGTCWVGVLGGAEKLSEVATREGRKIKEFGYINTDDPRPIIRLACQAQGLGAVSIVIPPWNGSFGKYLHRQKETREETMNAKR